MDNFINTSCNLCGSDKVRDLFLNYDRMMGFEDVYKLVKCSECGLISINPIPDRVELSKHYDKNNYSVFIESRETKHLRRLLMLLQLFYNYSQFFNKSILGIFISIVFFPIKSILRPIKVVENGKYLDVGCGIGYFLLVMKFLGMDPYGVEPGEIDSNLAKDYNLNIFNGMLHDAKYESNFFDIITLNHVLEHVENPSEYLAELYRILKPGGRLIISVPLSDSLSFWLFGKFWAQLDTPRHLYAFSKNNLFSYAAKYGYNVISIKYNSTPSFQFICSFLYIIESLSHKRYNRAIIFNPFLNILLFPLSVLLNFLGLADQGEIIMKKKES